MLLTPGLDATTELTKLQQLTGLVLDSPAVSFRLCPGSHECLMGLAATRDLVGRVMTHISEEGKKLTWALSGCANSCSQPQLADVGIMASRMIADADGEKTPRFDLYRRENSGLGEKVHESLTEAELTGLLLQIK